MGPDRSPENHDLAFALKLSGIVVQHKGLLISRGLRNHDVEDLMQTINLIIVKYLHRVDGVPRAAIIDPEKWVAAVVRNAWKSWLRHANRKTAPTYLTVDHFMDEPHDSPPPDVEVLVDEEIALSRERVLEVIYSLKLMDQRILHLRIKLVAISEIARIVNASESTVRRHFEQIGKQIKDAIGADCSGFSFADLVHCLISIDFSHLDDS